MLRPPSRIRITSGGDFEVDTSPELPPDLIKVYILVTRWKNGAIPPEYRDEIRIEIRKVCTTHGIKPSPI